MAALYLVFILFGLAIIAPFVFPNEKVSDNEHDIKGSTEE